MRTETCLIRSYQCYLLHTLEMNHGHTRDKGGIGLSA
jgi:hypothetical protein